MENTSLLIKLKAWRKRNISDYHFIIFLSFIAGIAAGLGAVVIKHLVRFIEDALTSGFTKEYQNYLYFLYPALGVFITVIFIRYILRKPVGDGVPNILYAISRNNGIIKAYQMFASIITSSLTVGFGGSVGLEGPSVLTGGAIGSNIGRLLDFDYRKMTLLVACAAAGAVSAIFKAPIAGIVFALEVLMIDLTMSSLIPLLVASVTGAIISYIFMGQTFIYAVTVEKSIQLNILPWFAILGLLSGFVSLHFTRVYFYVWSIFRKIKSWVLKILIGGAILGILIFLLPSLYGEGYDAITSCLHGDYSYLFNHSIFYGYRNNTIAVILMFMAIVFFKCVATSTTFGAGGIGGIIAPTLFIGANSGLFFAEVLILFGVKEIVPANFALVGMGGLIAGVLHAPLTGIFLIAELTGGYQLFFPLMITATIAYSTINYFEKNSVYTKQLAHRGELFTHDKDKMVIALMNIRDLLETNFKTIEINSNLGQLVEAITESKRNVFPVVDGQGIFQGTVHLNDIRDVLFKPELYEKIKVSDLMQWPMATARLTDTMEEIVEKFQKTHHFNIVVLDEGGKYIGFVSRANVFSRYRNIIKEFSED